MAKVSTRRASRKTLTQALAKLPRAVIIILLTLFLGGLILLLTLLPSVQPFEGKLTVQQLSFTSNESNLLWLKNIRRITKISGTGVQENFPLLGPFEGSDPRLKFLPSELTLKFSQPDSRWTIEPLDPKASRLTLRELKLQQDTRVNELNYYGSKDERALTFALQPDRPAGAAAADALAQLSLEPGGAPLKITLQGFEFLTPKRPFDDQPLSLILRDPSRLEVTLTQPTKIDLELPKPEKAWFWGDIAVRQVDFTRLLEDTGNFSNNVDESTIVSGKILMADRQLTIDENQFLLINDQAKRLPGIESLRRLEITEPKPSQGTDSKTKQTAANEPDGTPGLRVNVSGRAHKVAVGLSPRPKFSVSVIQPTLAEQFLPKEYAIAFISFCSAIFVALIGWLIDNLSKAGSKS